MDIEKLAQVRAKQKNRKIKDKYPLFADQFAISVEQEKQRILRQREAADKHLEEMRCKSREAWQRGLEYREVAKQILPLDVFENRERAWRKLKPTDDPDHDGYDLADWWFSALNGTDYAREHCPNSHHHNNPIWWRPRWNYLLGKYVEIDRCPTCGCKKEDVYV